RLLESPVEIADLRDTVENPLAVQLDQVAQRPVRGGMRRPDVQDHGFARLRLESRAALREEPAASLELVEQGVRLAQPLPLVDVVILAERMSHELVVIEDAPQVGVSVEAHSVLVERLALSPVGRF